MRSCDETLELISAALDGALTDEEQAVLKEHLSNCPACSALFAELSGLHAAAAQLEEVPAPAGFSDQVMARIAADPFQEPPGSAAAFPAKKRSRIAWKGWAATAAAVAVVVLGATVLDGRMNIGSTNDSASSAQVPSVEEDAGFSSDNSEPTEFSPRTTEGDEGGAFRNDIDIAAAPESAYSDQDSMEEAADEAEDIYGKNVADSLPSSVSYCGVLILTGDPLPEGLEDYDCVTDSAGTATYTVPADYFFACLAQLENQNAVNFSYDASDGGPAEYGLIVVETLS